MKLLSMFIVGLVGQVVADPGFSTGDWKEQKKVRI